MTTTARERELLAFVERIREQLAEVDPSTMAKNTGTTFDTEIPGFDLTVLGRHFVVPYPSFVVREAAVDHHEGSLWMQALVAHYFRIANGRPIANKWIALRDLPNGMLYEKAFQGYSGDKLAKAFGDDFEALSIACRKLRGSPESMGDLSYRFLALPYVPLAMVYWSGDEDFPAAAKVLFDESASHYLPTDALATLGGRLCNMILYAAGLLTQDPQHEHHDHHDHDH